MRTEQLQYFLKTAQTGSMRIAADALFVSQPALSNGIKQLEKELGYTLFNRFHNGVTLTEEGNRAIPIITRALEELNSLPRLKTAAHLSALHPDASGQLKILTVHSQMLSAIPALIRYFKFHYPGFSFFVFEKGSSEVLDGVIYDNYDLGLISLNAGQADHLKLPEDMVFELFDQEQAYIRIQKQSTLAAAKEVTIEQLSSFPLVFPNSSAYDEFTISKFFGDVPPQNVILQTNNKDLLDSFCLENDCAMPCYRSIQNTEYGLSDRYKLIPIADMFTNFYAIYPQAHPQLIVIQNFVHALKNYYYFEMKN